LYQGPALLFRASEKGLSAANQEKVWNQFVPDLGIIEVDGHHGNIIEPPQVQFLAERLKAHLEAAYQQRNAAIVAGSGFITQHSSTSLEIA
jgi:thioesterase domain-containing protein